jgi:hypothetical protein
LTFTVVTLWQPVLKIYEIGADPPETPAGVTMPLDEPIFATLVLPLTHVPPLVTQLNVVVPLAHIVVVPVIKDGNGFTVTIAVTKQPPVVVYVIFAVPVLMPVYTPVPLTILTLPVPALAVHDPPGVALVAVAVSPPHTDSVPPMAAGKAFTVTVVTALHPVDNE